MLPHFWSSKSFHKLMDVLQIRTGIRNMYWDGKGRIKSSAAFQGNVDLSADHSSVAKGPHVRNTSPRFRFEAMVWLREIRLFFRKENREECILFIGNLDGLKGSAVLKEGAELQKILAMIPSPFLVDHAPQATKCISR